MKASVFSAILLALSAVDAKKHRLCCCTGIDSKDLRPWDQKPPTCIEAPQKTILENGLGRYINSTKKWSYQDSKKYPLNDNGSYYWWYAADTPIDDNWVGGEEASRLCAAEGYTSECWSMETRLYRNEDFPPEESQSISGRGEAVVERDVDILERKENSTKLDKHHGAGYHKNKTSHHGNSTKTKHHGKPKTTAPPTKLDLHYKRDDTNVTTYSPLYNGTAASGKPRTTFHQLTKSHHYGNGTASTPTWPATHPTASAGGVVYCNHYWKAPGCVDKPDPAIAPVYCNQYWKAPGCIDKPDPSAMPVVCGKYWKAKGCVPAPTGL